MPAAQEATTVGILVPSLPDPDRLLKRHLNSLYVTSQGSYLSRDGLTVSVRLEDRTIRVPIHNIESIICFGNVLCTPFLLGLCGERGVNVAFHSLNGRFLARVVGPVSGNVLLRKEQYRRAESLVASAEIARSIVIGKIVNCRTVLLRSARDHPSAAGVEVVQQAAHSLQRLIRELRPEGDLDYLRGVEGAAGRHYFEVFDHLILDANTGFVFERRSRRPPMDRVNALLSFAYTILVHDVAGALQSVGLDPQVGFLHRGRPGRPSLALDLMEELRPFLADRLVLSLINRKQVTSRHFEVKENGAVLLNDDGRKVFLTAYQKRKDDQLTHPFIGDKTSVGLLPHLQALLLARHLRGDLDGYPPFSAR